jgi:hypothetical protein
MAKRSRGLRGTTGAKRSEGSARMSETKKTKSAEMDFRGAVLQQLSEWSAQDPTATVIAPASDGSKALTRSDLHSHVKRGTTFGKQLVESWMQAAIRSVMLAKK